MKKAKRSRDQSIYFMVTAAERKAIEKRMESIGISNMGAFMRKMALDGYVINLDLSGVKEMVSLLRRCSNNLNQYTRKAHQTNSIFKKDVEDLGRRLDKLWDAANAIMNQLSQLPRS